MQLTDFMGSRIVATNCIAVPLPVVKACDLAFEL
jgi:hypothetical protein